MHDEQNINIISVADSKLNCCDYILQWTHQQGVKMRLPVSFYLFATALFLCHTDDVLAFANIKKIACRYRLASLVLPSTPQEVTSIEQTDTSVVGGFKDEINKSVVTTKRGLKASKQEQEDIEVLLQKLEGVCELSEPARSPCMAGKWVVDYSTAPPPSNGKLGPFDGKASQIIDLVEKSYVNLLTVEPNDWLTAELFASWEEWDGIILEDESKNENDKIYAAEEVANEESLKVIDNDSDPNPWDGLAATFANIFQTNQPLKGKSAREDFGATCWKVTFDKLRISVFGNAIFEKIFEDTARVWKMTYVDESTRIVRAGRTGESEDDVVFYMSREQP